MKPYLIPNQDIKQELTEFVSWKLVRTIRLCNWKSYCRITQFVS
jgi:hypothetical protein